ncbi:response regulator transcription factor [Sphingomonas sp. 10B4]|uniref:response regulator transcription factor n=1 Tax=Sphingomonas sp. 10B4 TaxID=3048575 RepID=UPI002AB593B0|nr:response regulator [Sphingomonas sp. 10B4]MDY7526243.1 response regulator [Sphingomonas sp. 10B4]MEB0283483.1 response regulator [Sphingomonas sp. 10B4]
MAKILIVDDEDVVTEIAKGVLMQAGHSITIVRHGDEALAAVAASRPDLVILDYTLPGRTGRDILRELRTLPSANDMPIMMLTSRHGRVHSGVAEIDGADDYVTKPFDPADLLARVEALLIGSTISRRVSNASTMDDAGQ